MNVQSKDELFEQARREHEELRELLGSVHRTLARRLESVSHVAQLLVDFCEHVERHFNEEEAAGFFEQVAAAAPRFTERTEALCNEHQELLAVVRRLAERAREGDGASDWWERLDREFRQFGKDLMHHEQKENDLLQETYTRDIGPCD